MVHQTHAARPDGSRRRPQRWDSLDYRWLPAASDRLLQDFDSLVPRHRKGFQNFPGGQDVGATEGSDQGEENAVLGVVGIPGPIAITNMNTTEPNTIHWRQNTSAGGHDVGSKE